MVEVSNGGPIDDKMLTIFLLDTSVADMSEFEFWLLIGSLT